MHISKSRLRTLLVTGTVAASVLGYVALMPGVANASFSKCGWELNGEKNVWTCMDVTGGGDHIDTTTGSIDVQAGGRSYDMGITYFPPGCTSNGCATLLSGSGFHYDAPYTYHSISWNPESNEPGGEYCNIVWRTNLSTEVAKECVDVHA